MARTKSPTAMSCGTEMDTRAASASPKRNDGIALGLMRSPFEIRDQRSHGGMRKKEVSRAMNG